MPTFPEAFAGMRATFALQSSAAANAEQIRSQRREIEYAPEFLSRHSRNRFGETLAASSSRQVRDTSKNGDLRRRFAAV